MWVYVRSSRFSVSFLYSFRACLFSKFRIQIRPRFRRETVPPYRTRHMHDDFSLFIDSPACLALFALYLLCVTDLSRSHNRWVDVFLVQEGHREG